MCCFVRLPTIIWLKTTDPQEAKNMTSEDKLYSFVSLAFYVHHSLSGCSLVFPRQPWPPLWTQSLRFTLAFCFNPDPPVFPQLFFSFSTQPACFSPSLPLSLCSRLFFLGTWKWNDGGLFPCDTADFPPSPPLFSRSIPGQWLHVLCRVCSSISSLLHHNMWCACNACLWSNFYCDMYVCTKVCWYLAYVFVSFISRGGCRCLCVFLCAMISNPSLEHLFVVKAFMDVR